MAGGQLAVRRDHAQLFLTGEGFLAQLVPALVELALVLVGPLLGDVMRGVGRAWREVDEEGLIGRERLLLAHPGDGLVGQIRHEVVALFGCPVGRGRGRPFVERRVVLVGLPTNEAEKVLEAVAGAWPVVERAGGAGLPHRHLVALADVSGGIAVEPQRLGEWGAGVRADRIVAGRRGGHLGDAAHPDCAVVATSEQRRSRRRAERRRVEAGIAQPFPGEPLGGGSLARSAKSAGGAEANIVEQDDQHVGRPSRGPQRGDGWEPGVGVLGVIDHQPWVALFVPSDCCDMVVSFPSLNYGSA